MNSESSDNDVSAANDDSDQDDSEDGNAPLTLIVETRIRAIIRQKNNMEDMPLGTTELYLKFTMTIWGIPFMTLLMMMEILRMG